MTPIIIDIPHDLDATEVKRRMDAGVSKLPSHIPGGMAQVRASWLKADQMQVDVTAMGKDIATTLDVQERLVRIRVQLPLLLSFAAGPIEAMVRRSGEKLLLEQHKA